MFEHHREPLLPKRAFYKRVLAAAGAAAPLLLLALVLGVVGYHVTEGMDWLDALLNASMILSGMGPVQELHHNSGKWFASFYAIFSGVVFITTMSVVLAPVVHRFLHKFHLEKNNAER